MEYISALNDFEKKQKIIQSFGATDAHLHDIMKGNCCAKVKMEKWVEGERRKRRVRECQGTI
jgi:hypothetical protein